MTDWNKFKMNTTRAGNNKSLDGGKYLELGEHDLTIESVDLDVTQNGRLYVAMTLVNEDGQEITDRLYPTFENDGKVEYSYKYSSLAFALAPDDGVLRFKYFLAKNSILADSPQAWGALVGLKVHAEIVQQKRGYTIEETGGVYTLVDVETGAPYDNLPDGAPNNFESIKEAKDAARGNGLFRAYNEIRRFEPVADAGIIETNQTALSGVVG